MARDIRVQWYRGGSDVAHLQSPDIIPMQLDLMSEAEAAYYGGSQPYFRYHGFVNTRQYNFLYRDLLIDVDNADPLTNGNAQYRIINHPKDSTLSGYRRFALDKVVGT